MGLNSHFPTLKAPQSGRTLGRTQNGVTMTALRETWNQADAKTRVKIAFTAAAFLSPIAGVLVASAAPSMIGSPASEYVQGAAVLTTVALHLASYRLVSD